MAFDQTDPAQETSEFRTRSLSRMFVPLGSLTAALIVFVLLLSLAF